MDTTDFGKKIIEYENEVLFLTNSSFFNRFDVTNWKHNRPCDEVRIKEIRENIKMNNRVDGIFYIAQLISESGINYVCYDGNHRRNALKNIENEYPILVNILFWGNNNRIVKKFVALNKACPVPEIYIKGKNRKNEQLKLTIESVIKEIVKVYPKNQSPSKNPQRPNYNRDNLADKLYLYFRDNKIYPKKRRNFRTNVLSE